MTNCSPRRKGFPSSRYSPVVDGFSPSLFLRVERLQVERLQVDHDCLLCIAHDYPLRGGVRRIVGLHVRREGWHIHKITSHCFPLNFHMLAPAHHYLSQTNLNYHFHFSLI